MFGDVVLGIDHEDFEHELSGIKKAAGAKFDIELTAAHLQELVTKYKVRGCVDTGTWVCVFMCGGVCGLLLGCELAWSSVECATLTSLMSATLARLMSAQGVAAQSVQLLWHSLGTPAGWCEQPG
jgi:hypothetical protein